MTRDDVKKLFPEATDEQISALLNQHHGDIQKEKNKVETLKTENEKLKDIEKEAEALKNANLTAEQKAEKAIAAAEAAERNFNTRVNRLEVEKLFVANGLVEDEYSSVLDGIVTDNAESTMKIAQGLVGLLKSQKEATEKSVRAQILKETPRPEQPGNSSDGMTKEKFRALSPKERYEFSVNNPEEYKNLYGGNE